MSTHNLRTKEELEKKKKMQLKTIRTKLNNELDLTERLRLCRRWFLYIYLKDPKENYIRISGYISGIATIRMWPGGGLSGVVHKDGEKDKREFENLGDIFGTWNSDGVSFFMLLREQDAYHKKGLQLITLDGQFTYDNDYVRKYEKVIKGKVFSTKVDPNGIRKIGVFEMFLFSDFDFDKKDLSDIRSKRRESFMSRMRERFINETEELQFFDFKVICNDETEVKCHKMVLASQTKYFDGLFRQNNCDSSKIDFSGDIVRACIEYLYTEFIEITGDNVQDIIIAANFLIIPEIVEKCIRFIFVNMDSQDCIDVLNFGNSYNFDKIMKRTIDVISFSFDDVVEEPGNLEQIPLHLFESIISNDNLNLRNSYKILLSDQEKKTKLNEIAKRYCKMTHKTKELENLLKLIEKLPEKKVFHPFVNPPGAGNECVFGFLRDNPRTENNFKICGNGEPGKYIREITIKTDFFGGEIVVSGFSVKWSSDERDEVGDGDVAANLVVPDGEHISLVYGFSLCCVHSLSFVLSDGRHLGADIGGEGDGEELRNSMKKMPPNYHLFNSYLDGIKGRVVESGDVTLITGVEFQYGLIMDKVENQIMKDLVKGINMHQDNQDQEQHHPELQHLQQQIEQNQQEIEQMEQNQLQNNIQDEIDIMVGWETDTDTDTGNSSYSESDSEVDFDDDE